MQGTACGYSRSLRHPQVCQESPIPLDFSVPMEANQDGPLLTMVGTDAMVSTLLITVGEPYSPAIAGYGGLSLVAGP